jgi:hypothetical protein
MVVRIAAGKDALLSVYLENVARGERTPLEDVTLLQIVGSSLLDGHGNVRARYAEGAWHALDGGLVTVIVASALRVRFADGKMTEPFGPYRQARLVDAALRVGEGDDTIAHLNEVSLKWLTFGGQGRWERVIIEPVSRP